MPRRRTVRDLPCEVRDQRVGEQALFGAIGSDSTGSVVWLHTTDNKSYWIENSANCALRPKPRAPPADVYKMMPPLRKVGIGPHGNQFHAHGGGKTTAHWELGGVRVSAQIEVSGK